MKLKKYALIFLLGLMSLMHCDKKASAPLQVNLVNGWKFMNCDSLVFARIDYDDAHWKKIAVDQSWNKQGYPHHEGFAWYRIKVRLPSKIRNGALLGDSVVFYLGKIDDFDEVFLNGALIGENLRTVPPGTLPDKAYKNLDHSYWDVARRYALAVNDPRIKWDADNVIAIRVYDWGVAGGIYSGNLHVAMPDISEYLQLTMERNRFKRAGDSLRKTLKLENRAQAYSITGQLQINVTDNINGAGIFHKIYDFNLAPKTIREISFRFLRPRRSSAVSYRLRCDRSRKQVNESEGVPYILTPPVKAEPQINGARIYGQRPGVPFLYRLAVSGRRPMRFSVIGLPSGLTLNESSGLITGRAFSKGRYPITVTASNALGSDTKTLLIVIGDQLALTPPMGWNSWNCWGLDVSQQRVLDAANAFVKTGLADHGWSYINVDDGWEISAKSGKAGRWPNGEIRCNEKFPDMKALGDSIHRLGLKFAIYSSPGPLTCGGYTASYGHEMQDARTFAAWGVDYLKYDLCSYRKLMKDSKDKQELIPPYRLMYQALRGTNRDMVYSICEYGNGRVWEWGAEVGGNLWRTTGDIWDNWERMCQIGFGQTEAAPYARPGGWNDPDMLVIGWLGWGENLHYTHLTPDEQYTHVSLWALLSAPLLLGNDLRRLDDFTLNLLTNDEVLAVDQDILGRQALPVIHREGIQVWKKKLADGNWAVGIFNLGKSTRHVTLRLNELGFRSRRLIRDLWRQKNLGRFGEKFRTSVPAHGVTLIKVIEE